MSKNNLTCIRGFKKTPISNLSTIHMRKIYTGMYLYIYVNILRYVKRATSKVTLCSHEQEYFLIDIIFLILAE